MKLPTLGLALAIVALPRPAVAEPAAELDYARGSLGFEALMSSDYAMAEQQLRRVRDIEENDPARLINLGQVLARTGRIAEAEGLFRRAMAAPDGELIMGDGAVMGSREAAARALRGLPRIELSSR